MTSRASGRPSGRPPSTSRAQILLGAQELIERDGWQKLTIRHLAGYLGVGAATLYHHVRDREDLLVQLLNARASELQHPAMPEDPAERIVAAATAIHDTLSAAPWATEILIADDLVGEDSLRMVETMVAAAIDCGLTPIAAADLYRSIWYFTAGEILVRSHSARRNADRDRPNYRDSVFRDLSPTQFPVLAGLGNEWPSIAQRDTYQAGLRALVEGLLQRARAD
ncbi:TetR/AcrR family transcriptional regulator [Leifsonia sp. 2MCAF36]|uniref:TetR/AcrR family transcriptional regulator n=1 Tax=Leifsonia sp. 2MCAF36 TaxID=3232988 RepID=UPI003F97C596